MFSCRFGAEHGENQNEGHLCCDEGRGKPKGAESGSEQEKRGEELPDDERVIGWRFFDRAFVDQGRCDEEKDEQRCHSPSQEVDQRRTIPSERKLGRFPGPILSYQDGIGLETQFEQKHQRDGTAQNAQAIIRTVPIFAPAEAGDSAGVEDGDDP